MTRVLVDTGPIVAIFNAQDEHHLQCTDELRELSPPLITCWPVLTEAAWLLRHNTPALQRLMAGFASKLLCFAALETADLPEIDAILRKYRSLGLQIADAAILHLAQREAIQTVFTLDRRDFSIVRLNSGKKLRLIP